MNRRVAVLTMVAVAMAGCGSDDAGDDTATAVEPAEATEPAEPAEATEPTEPTEASEPAEAPEPTEPVAAPEPTEPVAAPEPTEPAAAGDPCALLDGVDVDGLLAEPTVAGVGELSDLGDTCRVESAADESRAGLLLSVSDGRAADNYERQRELLGVDAEISGLGDAAFHTGPYLFVRSEDTMFFVQALRDAANGFAVPDPDMEVAAAQILANLGR